MSLSHLRAQYPQGFGPGPRFGQAFGGAQGQAAAAYVVQHRHIKKRRGGSLFLVAERLQPGGALAGRIRGLG